MTMIQSYYNPLFLYFSQAWACIVCGYCLGLGIRFAGTSDINVTTTLWHYTDLLIQLSSKESKLSEYFPKNFLDSTICNLLMALSLVLAGTGDIPVLRLCRYLQARVSSTQVTISSTTYGLQMCISLATGILFLGAGRYSLSNDDKSIAVLLASVFPKWPINANDNRYELYLVQYIYC
jgi:anaphase-promoting complex subunit 1